jgi:hypothetical protein
VELQHQRDVRYDRFDVNKRDIYVRTLKTSQRREVKSESVDLKQEERMTSSAQALGLLTYALLLIILPKGECIFFHSLFNVYIVNSMCEVMTERAALDT